MWLFGFVLGELTAKIKQNRIKWTAALSLILNIRRRFTEHGFWIAFSHFLAEYFTDLTYCSSVFLSYFSRSLWHSLVTVFGLLALIFQRFLIRLRLDLWARNDMIRKFLYLESGLPFKKRHYNYVPIGKRFSQRRNNMLFNNILIYCSISEPKTAR